MRHQSTPLCAFCWPTLTVAEMIEQNSLLPSCARCIGKQRAPTMPSFLWRDLRIAARMWLTYSPESAEQPTRTLLAGDPSWVMQR